MTLKTDKGVILSKTEATEGVDATPDGTTNASSPMTFVVQGDRISGMAFLGLKGVETIRVQATNPIDATFMVNKDITDQLQRQLANIRAKPTVFVGAQNQYESLTVFGFYRDFSIVIQYPTKSLCTMQIEGLA